MKIFLCFLLALSGAASAGSDKYSLIGGTRAVPLSMDNAYFRVPQTAAHDYWSLASFYVPQYNGYACSAASVSMALNALLNARRERGDADENILQQALVENSGDAEWKALLSDPGLEGRHGVTLAQLGRFSRKAFAAYGSTSAVVAVTMVESDDAGVIEAFRAALVLNERNKDDILLLHFAQDLVTGAPGGPYAHTSPVGAYDAKNRRVLIFDVDRQWYEPYWVSDIQLLKAMELKTVAFGHGGYVSIKSGN
jgi:hypothetical protein